MMEVGGCNCGPNTMVPRAEEVAEMRQEAVEMRDTYNYMVLNMPMPEVKEPVVHSPASPLNKGIQILG